jgi:phospholipid/cholesterol/gamma-HCH transport system permease protein
MSVRVPSKRFPRVSSTARRLTGGWFQLGQQTEFYGQTVANIGHALRSNYAEILRLIAQMSLGTGALAVIGGTVVVVGFLTMSTGALIAVQGYNQLAGVGVEALTGFTSAYVNVRIIAPVTAAIALAATIGAGATAQLGAMRINEEIDALEVMAVRSIAYLASTRVIAGLIVVLPLYGIAILMSFLAARFGTTMIYGQSTGVYDHYFRTFLRPTDVMWSFFQAVTMAFVIMLIHTYYGFNAHGGPAGVGEAVGRAVRTSLIASVFVIVGIALAVYGQSGGFYLSG